MVGSQFTLETNALPQLVFDYLCLPNEGTTLSQLGNNRTRSAHLRFLRRLYKRRILMKHTHTQKRINIIEVEVYIFSIGQSAIIINSQLIPFVSNHHRHQPQQQKMYRSLDLICFMNVLCVRLKGREGEVNGDTTTINHQLQKKTKQINPFIFSRKIRLIPPNDDRVFFS